MKKVSMIFATMIASALLANCSSAHKTETATPATQTPVATAPTPIATPATPKESDTSLWQCTKSKDARTLQVSAKDKGCELNYTKSGKNSVASSSIHSMSHCVQSEKKIKSKLEKSGYTCEVKM